jgi:hypothetical protein
MWKNICPKFMLYFLIRLVGGEVQLGPLGTSATNWPIVLAPSDYEDGEFGGMMISRGNQITRRNPAPVPLCPPQIQHELIGREPGPPGWEASDKPLELWHGLKVYVNEIYILLGWYGFVEPMAEILWPK